MSALSSDVHSRQACVALAHCSSSWRRQCAKYLYQEVPNDVIVARIDASENEVEGFEVRALQSGFPVSSAVAERAECRSKSIRRSSC
eukprot:3362199-Rhodomonas_salina.1